MMYLKMRTLCLLLLALMCIAGCEATAPSAESVNVDVSLDADPDTATEPERLEAGNEIDRDETSLTAEELRKTERLQDAGAEVLENLRDIEANR